MLSQGLRTITRQPIRTSPILRGNRFDQALSFESGQCFVQRARSEPDSGKTFDILREGVAMFFAISQTREDQERRTGITRSLCQIK